MTSMTSDVVIVGGSIAALRAAESVSRRAPELSITIVSDEPHPPYERPPLSKIGLHEEFELDALTYPGVGTLQEQGATFLLNTRAEGLDVTARTVQIPGGEIHFGTLIVATGCEPVVPAMFSGLSDAFSLRRYEDASALRASAADPSKSVAIVGAGFIGGELASTLAKEGRSVSLIDLAAKPLIRFGEAVSNTYEELHRDAGISLHLGSAVVDVVDHDGSRALLLADGTKVPADLIIVGIGVRPSTQWLEGSGLTLENGIVCDSRLSAADRVFAAGDAVRWHNQRFGAEMRIEHWTNAAEQGRVAGLNAANILLGQDPVICANVPYFWSDQHGARIQFAGYLTGEEEIVESRNADGSLFLYKLDGIVTAVLAFERRAQFVRIRTMLKHELSWQAARELVFEQEVSPAS